MPGEHQMPAPMSSAAGADAGPTAKKSAWFRTYSLGTPRCCPPGVRGASSRARAVRPSAVPVPPGLLVVELLHPVDVGLRAAVVPVARVPRAHAAPEVAAALAAEVLPTLEAAPQHRGGVVERERGHV